MEVVKSHYQASEILELLNIKPYFLRFWETEFEQLNPITSDSGQKIYTPKYLMILKKIQKLLSIDQVPIQRAKILIDKDLDNSYAINDDYHKEKTENLNKTTELNTNAQEVGSNSSPSNNINLDDLTNLLSNLKSKIISFKSITHF